MVQNNRKLLGAVTEGTSGVAFGLTCEGGEDTTRENSIPGRMAL